MRHDRGTSSFGAIQADNLLLSFLCPMLKAQLVLEAAARRTFNLVFCVANWAGAFEFPCPVIGAELSVDQHGVERQAIAAAMLAELLPAVSQ